MVGVAGISASSVLIYRNRVRRKHKEPQINKKVEIKDIFDVIEYTNDMDKLKDMIKNDKKCLEKRDKHFNQTPLMRAIIDRKSDMVEFLLEQGSNINAKDIDCRTVIEVAIESQNTVMFNKLLELGAEFDKKEALKLSIHNNNVNIFETLYNKSNIQTEQIKQGLLRMSIKFNANNIVKFLLEKDLNINYMDKNGVNNFMYAIKYSTVSTRNLEMLLNHGANINSVDKENNTALHFAAKTGNKMVVDYLSKKMSNINAINNVGDTPLIVAVKEGRLDTIIGLVNNGADVTIPDKDGITAQKLVKTKFKNALNGKYSYVIKDIIKLMNTSSKEANKNSDKNCCSRITNIFKRKKTSNMGINM